MKLHEILNNFYAMTVIKHAPALGFGYKTRMCKLR